MNEVKLLSFTKWGLFLKTTLLSVTVVGLLLTNPVSSAVLSGAHRVCQLSMKSAERCQTLCDGSMGAQGHKIG